MYEIYRETMFGRQTLAVFDTVLEAIAYLNSHDGVCIQNGNIYPLEIRG